MTEYQQPLNPMRVCVLGDTEYEIVFAISIVDDEMSYMTIDGNLHERDEIAFVEIYVGGEWTCSNAPVRLLN
jgi:hypothetical protein